MTVHTQYEFSQNYHGGHQARGGRGGPGQDSSVAAPTGNTAPGGQAERYPTNSNVLTIHRPVRQITPAQEPRTLADLRCRLFFLAPEGPRRVAGGDQREPPVRADGIWELRQERRTLACSLPLGLLRSCRSFAALTLFRGFPSVTPGYSPSGLRPFQNGESLPYCINDRTLDFTQEPVTKNIEQQVRYTKKAKAASKDPPAEQVAFKSSP